jgi:hypothetical protein
MDIKKTNRESTGARIWGDTRLKKRSRCEHEDHLCKTAQNLIWEEGSRKKKTKHKFLPPKGRAAPQSADLAAETGKTSGYAA